MSLIKQLLYRYKAQDLFGRKSFFRIIGHRRFFLSDAYQCQDEWNQRLQTPLLKNVNVENLYAELDKRFSLKKKVSCVDIDVFSNCVNNGEYFGELENVLSNFRKRKANAQMLESTHTAVIRLYLQFNHMDALVKILFDKIGYGIFPDPFSYNVLMDYFLERKKHTEAAKISVLMMLQEELDNSISKILGLYSCHMYLREPSDPWYPKAETEEQPTEEDEEEVYVRIPYLRNPYFDDHFDLTKPEHLVGKTLQFIGKRLNNPVGKSYRLIGLGLHQKFKEAEAFLQEILDSRDSGLVYEDAIVEFKKQLEPVEGEEESNQIKASINEKLTALESSQKLIKESLHDKIVELANSVTELEVKDIEAQKSILKGYEHARVEALEVEMEELRRKEFEEFASTKRKELKEKEDLLFFFDNWNKHEMELAEIEEQDKKTGTVKGEVEEYIPPEVKVRR